MDCDALRDDDQWERIKGWTCPEEVESESLTFDRISPYDEHEEEFTRPPRQVHRCFQS
ncbi:hypothetical protein RvVAT039_pl09880 (plasmid) [Agrobacterium vitis]|nr:hypothetical protein RvVAT039_pl09880 [Agrobacterium vitis]